MSAIHGNYLEFLIKPFNKIEFYFSQPTLIITFTTTCISIRLHLIQFYDESVNIDSDELSHKQVLRPFKSKYFLYH